MLPTNKKTPFFVVFLTYRKVSERDLTYFVGVLKMTIW